MKNERLLELLGQVDETYIKEAAPDFTRYGGDVVKKDNKKSGRACDNSKQNSQPRYSWQKWGVIAAALALVLFLGIMLKEQLGRQADITGELPLLTIATNYEGNGFEGLMAYDVSELVNANPWNEDLDIKELPVYRNTFTFNENWEIIGTGAINEKEFVEEIRERLGELTGVEITTNIPTIAQLTFDPALKLPEGYNFNYHAPYSDMKAVAEYFMDEYDSLISMEKPVINIYDGDYDIYGRQGYSIAFYEGAGDILEQIINYNFNQIKFTCDEEGCLWIVNVNKADLSEKMGDYPIISATEAKELLLNGNYITTVPEEVAGEQYVVSVELVYRSGITEEVFMPYYRFLVELPGYECENGLKTYGAFYVPAVEAEYISNMPVWDGRFN